MVSQPINILKDGELVHLSTSIRDAARFIGVHHKTIQTALKRKPPTIKGFELKTVSENNYSMQKSVPTEFIERNNTGTVSGQAHTLDELLEKANVDLRIWEVDTYEIKDNSWDVIMADRDQDLRFEKDSEGKQLMTGHAKRNGHVTKTNRQFYIRARLKKREGADFIIYDDLIRKIAASVIKPIKVKTSPITNYYGVLRFTDTHIGMDTNPEGISMYPTLWNKEVQRDTFIRMAEDAAVYFDAGTHLFIEDLGDLPDGYNGQTARGGHDLPQNMSTEDIYDLAVELKFILVYTLLNTGKFSKISVRNACNDNHGGSMTYQINSHFKTKVELSFPGIVDVVNFKEFINHYQIGNVTHILTHGKDKKHKKFGFPAKPNPQALSFVHDYMDHHGLKGKVRFHKGDSHQQYNDYTSSHRFEWNSYLPLSPSSEWVQSNYGKSLRGFVMEKISTDNGSVNIQPVFL